MDERMWEMSMVPDGSNPGRNSCGYSVQIISDDLNKRLQFARMPARNVNYITRGALTRNVSFHSVECDVLSVAGETREGKKKRNVFSEGKMRSEIRCLRLLLI